MATATLQATMREGRLDIGRVGRETFRIIGADLAGTYGLAAALAAIPAVLSILFAAAGLTHPAPGLGRGAFGLFGLVMLLVGLGAGLMTYGAIGYGAVERLQGRSPSVGRRLSAAGAALGPLIGVGVLGYLGIAAGTLLFVAPGLFLATMWVAAVVAAVVDRRGVFGSFSRSAELTRGHRWMIFLLIVVFFLLAAAVGLLQLVLVRMGAAAGPVGATVVSGLLNVGVGGAVNAVGAVGAGVVYHELRRARGEFDPGRLAEVFS